MRRRRWAVAVVAVTGAVGVWPLNAAHAGVTTSAGTKTTTRMVNTICSYMNVPHNPGPFPATFAVTTTVPRRVASGSTFTVHLSVPFAVSPASEFGGAIVSADAGTDPPTGSVLALPGAASVTGAVTFTATGPPGSRVVWRFGGVGQLAMVGGVTASESCTPVKPFTVLNRTAIV